VGLVVAGVGEVTLREEERVKGWGEEEEDEGERVGDRGLDLVGRALAITAGVDWTREAFSLVSVASFRVPTISAPVEACPAPDPW